MARTPAYPKVAPDRNRIRKSRFKNLRYKISKVPMNKEGV